MLSICRRLSPALGLFFLFCVPAFAQVPILQGGPWAPGHAPMYVGGGGPSQPVAQDSGPAAGGGLGVGLSELGLAVRGTGTAPYANAGTGPLNTNLCNYDAPITNPTGYHYLCMSPNAQGGGLIAYGAVGAAATLPLQFSVNGSLFQLNGSSITGPGNATPGDIVTWGVYPEIIDGGAVPSVVAGGGISVTGGPAYTVSLTGGALPSVVAGTGMTVTGGPAYTVSISNKLTAGGPTGSASVVPVITYNAQGQLTAVTTATITPAAIGAPSLSTPQTWTALQTFNNGDFALAGSGSGSTLLEAASVASGVISIPSATDTVALLATSQTLTNKSISGSANTLSNIGNGSLTNSSMTIGGQSIALGGTTVNQGTGGKIQLSTGVLTNGHCLQADSTGNVIDAGGACTTGGGGGTVASATAGQIGYYATSGTTIAGNANVTISNGALSLGQSASVAGSVTLFGSTSGSTILQPTAIAGATTLTFPAATDTVAVIAAAQTLTNKTISGASNTLSSIANASLTNSSITIGGQSTALGGSTTNQGNGSKLQLSTGTTTTSDCVQYDASGNTTDAGAACVLPAASQSLTNKTIAFASNTLTGVAPLASPTFTGTVTGPNSGTWAAGGINATVLGATTPAAGTFTALTTTGNTILGGTLTAASLSTSGTVAGSVCATSAGLILYEASQNCIGGGSGTVNSGTGGQLTYYAGTGTAVSGNANATISSGALTMGQAGSVAGSLTLSGVTSGTVKLQVPSVAGTGTVFTIPATTGTAITSGDSGTVTGTIIATNTVALGNIAQSGANTVLGNGTGSTANNTALSVPSCSTAGSALKWTSATGFGCNTAIAASTVTTNANLTGDVTSTGNATTLATVNSNVGSFTNVSLTVNAKGLITAASNGSSPGLSSKIITFTRAINAASGNVSYTGTGFTPTSCHIHVDDSNGGNVEQSDAYTDSTGAASLIYIDGADATGGILPNAVFITDGGAGPLNTQTATIASYDSNGFTMAWTKTASTATAAVASGSALCYR